jgi:GDP-D-mannose 3', 5'-epimerase
VGIDIWGDGLQTRSFLYIDDCLDALYALMQSDHSQPLNIGSDRMVSINHLADIVGQAAGVAVAKNHVDGPQGVRGRNSDNTLCEGVLGWRPQVSLEDGIARTYAWIEGQVRHHALRDS